QRVTAGGAAATIAGQALGDGLHLSVRDVDHRVVEGHLAARVEHLTGQVGGATAGAGHLGALEVDALRAGIRRWGREPAIRNRRERRAHRSAGALDADLLQAAIDGAGAAGRRTDVVLAAARAARAVVVARAVIAHRGADGRDTAAARVAVAGARTLRQHRAHPGDAGCARWAVGVLRALLIDLAGTTGQGDQREQHTRNSEGDEDRNRSAVHVTSMS